MSDAHYIKFHLLAFPEVGFDILLRDDNQREIIDIAATAIAKERGKNYGKFKDLANHLHKNCKSLSKVKAESINDSYLYQWKQRKRFIPIDVALELFRLAKRDVSTMEKHLELIKNHSSANGNAFPFKFIYDAALAALCEAIKTEGHVKHDMRQCSISSADVDLMQHFKALFRSVGIPDRTLYENLALEADVPSLNLTKVLNEKQMELKFNVYKKGKKIKVRFYDRFKLGEKKSYQVSLKDGTNVDLFVEIPNSSQIKTSSSYGICSASINLNVTNITLCKILVFLCKVPVGKKSKIIRICPLLWDSPKSVKRAAINVIMACEGWVEPKARRIRMFVESKEYIVEVKKLLEEFGIRPTINGRHYLSISSRSDLKRFTDNFDLMVQEKRQKLLLCQEGYQRTVFRHGEGLAKTLRFLQQNDGMTAHELAKLLSRHKDTAFNHLNVGIVLGLVHKDTTTEPYKYFLTSSGTKYLEDKKCFV